jgi:hypothetical protein
VSYPPQQYPPYGQSETAKVQVRKHSDTFHLIMTCLSCGFWIPFWIADRRTTTIKTRRY